MIPLSLHPDRLFSSEPGQRALARALYATVKDLPIVSPHGHTDPQWFADNARFADPSALFIVPDHYVFRMLYSQGVSLATLGVPRKGAAPANGSPGYDARAIWRIFAGHAPRRAPVPRDVCRRAPDGRGRSARARAGARPRPREAIVSTLRSRP